MCAEALTTDLLRLRAQQLGFDLIGVTPADPLQAADFFARWVALGFAGAMVYLERGIDLSLIHI